MTNIPGPISVATWHVAGLTAETVERFWARQRELDCDVWLLQDWNKAYILKRQMQFDIEALSDTPAAYADVRVWLSGYCAVVLMRPDDWQIIDSKKTDRSVTVTLKRVSDGSVWHVSSVYLPEDKEERRELLSSGGLRLALGLDRLDVKASYVVGGNFNENADSETSGHGNGTWSLIQTHLAPLVDAFRLNFSAKEAFSHVKRHEGGEDQHSFDRLDYIWSFEGTAAQWLYHKHLEEQVSDHYIVAARASAPSVALAKAAPNVEPWTFPLPLLQGAEERTLISELFHDHEAVPPAKWLEFISLTLPSELRRLAATSSFEQPAHAHELVHLRQEIDNVPLTAQYLDTFIALSERLESRRSQTARQSLANMHSSQTDMILWSMPQKVPEVPAVTATDVQQYAQNLFEAPPTEKEHQQYCAKKVLPDTHAALADEAELFTAQEVRKALRAYRDMYASGPDGIPASVLSIGGEPFNNSTADFINSLKRDIPPFETQCRGVLEPRNDTHLPLDSVENYRLRSLCDTSIGLLHTILANRLIDFAIEDFGPKQSNFAQGRHFDMNVLELQCVAFAQHEGWITSPLVLLDQDLQGVAEVLRRDWVRQCLSAYGLDTLLPLYDFLYQNMLTRYRASDDSTENVRMSRGLQHGIPSTNALSMLALQPFLGSWSTPSSGRGLRLAGEIYRLSYSASADHAYFWLGSERDARRFIDLRKAFDSKSGANLRESESEITILGPVEETSAHGGPQAEAVAVSGSSGSSAAPTGHGQESDVHWTTKAFTPDMSRALSKRITCFGTALRMDGEPAVAFADLAPLIRNGTQSFQPTANHFTKAELMISSTFDAIWDRITFAGIVEGQKTLLEIERQITAFFRDGQGERISYEVLSTPRSHGGMGLPPIFATLQARLLAKALPEMCSASPSPMGTLLRNLVAQIYWNRWQLPVAALLALKRPLATDFRIDPNEALGHVPLRLVRAIQSCEPTLQSDIDWSTVPAEQCGALPWFSDVHGWAPLLQRPGTPHHTMGGSAYWVYSSDTPAPTDDWIHCEAAGVHRKDAKGLTLAMRLFTFADILWKDESMKEPSSDDPLLRLGIRPPTPAEYLAYFPNAGTRTFEPAARNSFLDFLRASWRARLSAIPYSLRCKLAEFCERQTFRDDFGPIGGARPIQRRSWQHCFPWHLLRFHGMDTSELSVHDLTMLFAPAKLIRPGTQPLPSTRRRKRSDHDSESALPGASQTKGAQNQKRGTRGVPWRETLPWEEFWLATDRYVLPGLPLEQWWSVASCRAPVPRDKAIRCLHCPVCPKVLLQNDHAYLECPKIVQFWKDSITVAAALCSFDNLPTQWGAGEILQGFPSWVEAQPHASPDCRLRFRVWFVCTLERMSQVLMSQKCTKPPSMEWRKVQAAVLRDILGVIIAARDGPLQTSSERFEATWRTGNQLFSWSGNNPHLDGDWSSLLEPLSVPPQLSPGIVTAIQPIALPSWSPEAEGR
ncbi:unnamed protein product [Jaminaea pallidilutea]